MNTTMHNILIFAIIFGTQIAIADSLTVGEWAVTVTAIGASYIIGLIRGISS